MMGFLLQVNEESPQPHRIEQAASLLVPGEVAAVPTDTGFSLVCRLEDKEGIERMRLIRQLDKHKHFTLLCDSLSQMSKLARITNTGYRLAKSITPGPYTFILEATREVPRRLAHPSKKTIGIRVPNNNAVQSLLAKIGEPLVSTTLILPGEEQMSEAWEIQDRLGEQLAFVLDDGSSIRGDTTILDFSGDEPTVMRVGLGDVSRLGIDL
jgi:tRNA threonylcarbamoyl adenosine modification protein (Sua5/YciO/YrdC/YwlC family)